VAELSETTTMLREELKAREEGLAMERRASTMKLQGMERDMTAMSAKIVELETRLSQAPHPDLVESMRRELRILKRLEYNAGDMEVDDGRDPEIAGTNNNEEAKDLESVLVAKLRRVESDLVTERTARGEIREEMGALRRALSEADQSKADLEKLVSSLERDLERAIATPAPIPSRTGSARKLDLVPTDGSAATLQQVLDPDSAPPSDGDAGGIALSALQPPQRSASITAQERADDDHSVATIVMAQRDRLRARCEALEAERDSFKHELQAQVQASESLKSDNTKLYEKVRYLQTYNNRQGSGMGQRGSAYQRGSVTADRDLDLEALEQRYEASVDPFKQFSRAERQRKLNEMSPMERTVFIVAKTFLGTFGVCRSIVVTVLVTPHLRHDMTVPMNRRSHEGDEDSPLHLRARDAPARLHHDVPLVARGRMSQHDGHGTPFPPSTCPSRRNATTSTGGRRRPGRLTRLKLHK
jgi:homeobox protein cut-like